MENKAKHNRYREMISDFLLVGGGAAVSIGVGMICVAAGIIVGGVLAMAFGWLIAVGGVAE